MVAVAVAVAGGGVCAGGGDRVPPRLNLIDAPERKPRAVAVAGGVRHRRPNCKCRRSTTLTRTENIWLKNYKLEWANHSHRTRLL